MFNLFKKTPPLGNFAFLGTDMHAHLLPGIDDGAKDIEDSLSLITQLQQMGYRHLITTPHIMADLYPNTPSIIRGKLEEVRKAIAAAGIDITIDAAAEYLMDEGFEPLLEEGELLTLPGNRVLVEMSFISAPPKLEQYLFRLQTKGYRPLLAHPERYLFFHDNFKKYHELKERGCEFQLNTLSLTGYYGKPTRENAVALLKAGLIDYLGTDLHHDRHADHLRAALESSSIAKLLTSNTFKNQQLH
ncbi:MAG: CpsB/CapC family capsule biosynthesis tyrosine phosphatase [Phaeodactylibacter sp.]|uniref:tyrosine-protein phosphatase n=1 Tax=Phaeodactylibacter sp. TaxID=1940289 RepID=UPI0032EF3E46